MDDADTRPVAVVDAGAAVTERSLTRPILLHRRRKSSLACRPSSFNEIAVLHGERRLEGVRWRNRRTGVEEDRAVLNVFLMLGAVPNTGWLTGCG